MDPDRINRWLTLIANFGVLVGIGLLLVELDQNDKTMRNSALQERNNQLLGIYGGATTSDSLAEALTRAESFYGNGSNPNPMQSFRERLVADVGLTEKQARQVGTHYGLIWNTYLMSYLVSDETEKSLNDAMIRGRATTGLGRLFYQHMREVMPVDFREHVDRLLEESRESH